MPLYNARAVPLHYIHGKQRFSYGFFQATLHILAKCGLKNGRSFNLFVDWKFSAFYIFKRSYCQPCRGVIGLYGLKISGGELFFMDEVQLRIIFVFTDLVLPLMIGYTLQKKHWINDKICNELIKFNIIGISTILSLLSFWVLPLSWELIWLPVIGILLCLVPGAISLVTFAKGYKNLLDRGSYLMSSMLSNIGTMGGLCAFILYGEPGFAYAQMVGVFQGLVLFSVCFPLAQYYRQKHQARTARAKMTFSLRSALISWNQLSIVGMFVGMGLYLFDVPRPAALGSIFNSLIHIGAWSGLLPIGYLINLHAAGKFYRRVADLVPLKFIIVPFLFYFLIKFLFTDQTLIGTLLILASTPTAINAVITARLYQLNVHLSVATFMLTTVIYLFIVFPLMFFYVTSGRTL